ncbi:hypothetical protein C8Q80DRAFT_1132805 [Daedaleopsis nitida]|nr:hypothetical protein C8Q80DRAFT_1132805 [Daedaleopsis nitida]
MDELVRHCLRELSFDGELGCDISRLRDFIADFYSHPSSNQVQGQNVDDAFCAFVWSVIVQQPGVRVGTIPPGGSTEVYIAPQASAIRKSKAKGEDAADEPAPATGLDIVLDAAVRSLEDLRQQYGDQLRIAVDPETTFAALTGSHIRPSKLTPMIYTGLQIITRGRDRGVSVLDLGKKSGYDQKTCFYIAKQLVDLNLVVKLRQPGVSTNICVHKYFYERSPIWQQVSAEEKKAVSEEQAKDGDGDSEDDSDQEETKPLAPVHFDSIDARHLSSLPVLKSRLTKLLKNCPHYMHTSHNLMAKIGFVNPNRTDRRFYRSRLRELMDEGLIEKVLVPHADRKNFPDRKVPCIRLITNDPDAQVKGEEVAPIEVDEVEELEIAHAEDPTGLRTNVSLHRQMIDCLADAGTNGMTLNEISAALGDFDKRTVDLLLNRLEKDPPPAHLADLGIAQLGETHGRERRYKYYTVAHYLILAEKEQMEDRRYRDVDMSAVGGFMPIDSDAFYGDEEELRRLVSGLSEQAKESQGSKGKGKKRVNPILPDGTVKRGRPRKSLQPDGSAPTPAKKGKKRKRENDEAGDADAAAATEEMAEPPPKKTRGRPPKNRPVGDAEGNPAQATPTSRRKGRAPKLQVDTGEDGASVAGPSHGSASQGPAVPRKRGRPKKSQASAGVDVVGKSDNEPDARTVSTTMDDIPMMERELSSPLSSLPSSPTPDDQNLDTLTPSPVITSLLEPEASTSTSTSLRRSSRAPKARKRGDSLSPGRGTRKNPSTQVIQSASSLVSATVTGPPGSAPITSPLPSASFISDTVDPSVLMPPPRVPFHAGVSLDIPIDPALLEGIDFSSLLAQGHSLIAMTPEPPEYPLAGPSSVPDMSKKRDQPESPSTEPLTKRTKSSQSGVNRFRSRANISQPRRENEILRLLAEADGIMNISSKEFYEAHAALVESLTKAGEPTSTAPGARIDKRTVETTLNDLQTKGKINLVTTTVPTPTGSQRMARVAYLSDVSEEALNVFLSELNQALQNIQFWTSTPSVKTVEEPVAYGGGRQKGKERASTSKTHKQTDEEVEDVKELERDSKHLFKQDDKVIHDVLLTEKNVVAQLYGYIVGRAARARALHMLTTGLLEKGANSPHIVSRTDRVVHLSYYFSEIPIATYCSLVAVLQPSEELGQLLGSPDGQTTPMHAVPNTIRTVLAPTQAKSRARVLTLMELLQALDLVTPLVPSESPNPLFKCASNSDHPTAFDLAHPGPYTPAVAPVYWRFHDIAPIRLWALGQNLPPVWKMESVATSDQAMAFWDDLEKASTDLIHAQDTLGSTPVAAEVASDALIDAGKTLRRFISWSSVYSLSFLQTEFLRRHIDPSTGHTPLDDAEKRNRQLERLAWIVSASKDVVSHWFEKARQKHIRDLNKIEKRKRKAEKSGEADAALAISKKEQRERDWDAMVARVHPSELTQSAAQRVQRVRSRYMHGSGKMSGKWEKRVAEAIKEADEVADAMLATARTPLFAQMPVAKPVLPPPVPIVVQDTDVDELIATQAPRVAQEALHAAKKSKKGKGKDTGETDTKPRRNRFLWTAPFDELAKDASVIIKARCRGPTRLHWGALEQVFPGVPINSVRQHLVHLKEVPGVEAYLTRLEDKWYDLWVQHRGTEALPDPDPESATNFDLATHVKFLRRHVDKNAVRIGFVEVHSNTQLPASLDAIEEHFDVVEKVSSGPQWDFMWNVVSEDAREKLFAYNAFTNESADMPVATSYDSEFLQVAESAVKMALGSPNEGYDAGVASQFLKGVGEESVRVTTIELLSRGVLAKSIQDPTKMKPGRTLKISDSNQNLLGGTFPRELFHDATTLEEAIAQQEGDSAEQWQEWSLLATDGDTAFLLELASENKVRFDVDTSHARSMRATIDWNSKKADDDDIETAVRVRYVDVAGPREASIPEPSVEPPGSGVGMEMEVDTPSLPEFDGLEHGHTPEGGSAFCRHTSEDLVDCQACLEQTKASLLGETADAIERTAAEMVLAALQEAGSTGLTKQQLLTKLDSVSEYTLFSVVQRMTEAPVPLAHWTGYGTVILVSAGAIRPWTVTVEGHGLHNAGREQMIFPRRWLDIYGRKVDEVWEAALRSVLGLVLMRPGISQADVRWRLRAVYDREEVHEMLQTLQEEGYITPRVDRVHRTFESGPAHEEDERRKFWFLTAGGRRWYQV